MKQSETINGEVITEEQIEAWAAEAEAGFDVAGLKRRGRGRPGRADTATQVITLRLTESELAAVDARAEREHVSRSEAIRKALVAYVA